MRSIESTITDEHKTAALREVNRRARTGARVEVFFDWAKTFIAAVAVFLIARPFVVEAYRIPSGSMEHTLLVNDFLFVNKAVYGPFVPFTNWRLPHVRSPRRGDVIVFQYPVDPTTSFVKRCVGIPGDTVEMRDGVLYVNGKTHDEPYVVHTEPGADPGGEQFRWQRGFLVSTAAATSSFHPSRNNWGPLVVPEQSYFVLGDNRDNSLDSRYWGFVPDSLLRGEPMVVYYSYERDSTAAVDWLTRVRWGRLGHLVQ